MKTPPVKFWFGYLYLGAFRSDRSCRAIRFGAHGGDAANLDDRCEIIPFPRDAVVRPFPKRRRRQSSVGERLMRRAGRGMEVLWNHPRTHGAFVMQRILAITLAMVVDALVDRIYS